METTEKKYTLIESFFILVFGGLAAGVVIPLIGLVTFPLVMLVAWIRLTEWNWFAVQYLHLPTVPYWVVVGLGYFISTFSHTNSPNGYKPTTKDTMSVIFMPLIAQLIGLGICYIIHIYLK